jgi:hypothetical protein
LRISSCMACGAARSGRRGTIDNPNSPVATAADRTRKRRRLADKGTAGIARFLLLLQRRKEGDDVLNLIGIQDRFAGKCWRDP